MSVQKKRGTHQKLTGMQQETIGKCPTEYRNTASIRFSVDLEKPLNESTVRGHSCDLESRIIFLEVFWRFVKICSCENNWLYGTILIHLEWANVSPGVVNWYA